MRIGFGYDVHPLIEGRDLILGGVKIPFRLGLSGHSDADVLIHALIDALLGAACQGNIGEHFPDTDPAYKGIDSIVLLSSTVTLLEKQGLGIVNVDSVIVAEQPKLAQYFDQMRSNLSVILKIPLDCVSVKAKKEEGLGFTGSLSGIKAYAVALLSTGDGK
ncbi:MAG: 2-C-methyl-D-erythritol 2,4-cyclodiphosphate synthase [Candidatus Wallbacteria bacterium]|nr:2-C-methyl-D-erythritol 2,4-cyclodiphosphate synthase [Candidatus Wallbacteria bacterium]